MTKQRRLLSLAGLASAVLVLVALAPGSRHALPSALAAPLPSASSSAAPPESLPVLLGKDLPENASPAPTDAEWARARAVRPHRGALGTCTCRSLREWLEIRCNNLVAAGLVAGDPKGVVVRITGQYPSVAVRAVVPLRRGEAKVLGFLEEVPEYSASTLGEAGTLSISWRENQPDPVLVASGFVASERPLAR